MDFRTINKFNMIMNIFSGNFFPTTGDKTKLGFIRTSYLIFTWSAEVIYLTTTAIGLLSYVPPVVAVRDSGVSIIVTLEVMITAPYLMSQQKQLRKLITKINSVVDDSEDFRRCIRESVDPHKQRLKVYTVATISAVSVWAILPMLKLLNITDEHHTFTYTDFELPTYYPGAPFTVNAFVCGIILQMIGAAYLIIKKSAIDIYVSYLITILTAQYRYVNRKITRALNQANDEESDELVIESLQECVQHHCTVMEIGNDLTKVLSVNVGLAYINCILRFCLLAFSILTLPEVQQKTVYSMYMTGSLIQVYMLCLCAQELLEASTAVTDDAFHETWYERGPTVKKIFHTMALGGNMECRMTAYRIVDLTVPTFALILNQAYSICLILLRIIN